MSFKCCFCCLIHKRVIMLKHFLFIIFMSISRSRSFYVVISDFFFFSSSFSLWLIVWSHEFGHTFSFAYFLEYSMSYYFHMKNVNNFQIAKVHLPRVLLSIGVAHKYIAFSKKRAFQQNFELDVRHRKMGSDSCQIENQKKAFQKRKYLRR